MAKVSRKDSLSYIPITLVNAKEWKSWLKKQEPSITEWTKLNGFCAEPGTHCLVPNAKGAITSVLAGTDASLNVWTLAGLPERLPMGTYRLENTVDAKTADALMLGWLLGSYRFTRYKNKSKTYPTLLPPAACDYEKIQLQAQALCNARDLITTPANDLGPAELADACRKVAKNYNAKYTEIVGEDLLTENYPAIYEVGKASTRLPRLVDMRWGNERHPKVTLVGKGVCFDSGGLDIKPSSGMKMMKKDMGGAACVLALAQMIMAAKLKVRLRVLIPAVENSISGNAYRPLDVIKTRKGLTVEIGNTDAEGRIILCDALFEADQEKPALLIDCATLTGAARTALGTDIPALFTHDDKLAADLLGYSIAESDPLWRLPLWQGYREMLNSPVADINSAPDGPYAGAITAALYLNEFVDPNTSWVHIDMMAWNLVSRPGRPAGGEAMAVRVLYAYIAQSFTS